jgi:hypothetical protein
MKIESIIRRKDGTRVQMGDMSYHFKPSANDPRHLEEVNDPLHIKRFLSITEGYRVPEGETVPELPAEVVPQGGNFLIGSDKFLPVYQFNGRNVELGEIVRNAFEASDLTDEEWNKLLQEERDSYIQDELDLLKAEEREKNPPDPDAPETNKPDPAVVLGTQFEPAVIEFGGKSWETKKVAEEAFAASGLDLEAWNALGNDAVMDKMSAWLESQVTAEDGNGAETAKPAEPASPAPETKANASTAKARATKATTTKAASTAKAKTTASKK